MLKVKSRDQLGHGFSSLSQVPFSIGRSEHKGQREYNGQKGNLPIAKNDPNERSEVGPPETKGIAMLYLHYNATSSCCKLAALHMDSQRRVASLCRKRCSASRLLASLLHIRGQADCLSDRMEALNGFHFTSYDWMEWNVWTALVVWTDCKLWSENLHFMLLDRNTGLDFPSSCRSDRLAVGIGIFLRTEQHGEKMNGKKKV